MALKTLGQHSSRGFGRAKTNRPWLPLHRSQFAHGSKLATEPEQLTLAPEPVLAPPPATLASTPIVLPATESAPEVAAANANKSAEGGVYWQILLVTSTFHIF